jgi:hypothetical protein
MAPMDRRWFRRLASAGPALVLTGCVGSWAEDPCAYTRQEEARLPAVAARRLQVVAGAGSLRLVGDAAAAEVVVHGTACASSPELLAGVHLVTRQDGEALAVEAVLPELPWSGGSASLDLDLTAPSSLAVVGSDSSGHAEIRGFASLRFEDGSGDLVVRTIAGDVQLVDGSGELQVSGVGGTLRVEDGSGNLEVLDVGRDVELEDGSGEVRVSGVEGSVVVLEDGSGDLRFSRVKGDVTVRDDGSGSIDAVDIGGQVRVPGSD